MFTRSTTPVLLVTISVLALSLLVAPGCETGDPTPSSVDVVVPKAGGSSLDLEAPPAQPGQGDFFPLQQGNRWEYARQLQVQVFPESGEPEHPVLVEARIESQITGTEIRDGSTYDIMERRWDEEGDSFLEWIRMRQDKGGLYEADVVVTEPPALDLTVRAQQPVRPERWSTIRQALGAQIATEGLDAGYLRTMARVQERHERILALLAGERDDMPAKATRRGGPQADELQRLAYPLHPKSTWTIREDPTGTATVEAREVLDLPAGKMPAWRIRWEWDFLEPADRVVVWYGRCGMLKLEAHTEGMATDMSGQPIGRLVAEENEILVDLDVQRGGCR